MAVHGYKVDNVQLQKQIDRITVRETTKLKNAAMAAIKKIVSKGITEWYENTKGDTATFAKAMLYEHKISQDSRYVNIDVYPVFDLAKYEHLTSHYNIYRWRKRHEKDGWRYYNMGSPQPAIHMKTSVPVYLVHLAWDSGYLGLPDSGKFTDWENPKTHKKEALYKHTAKYLRNQKRWNREIKKQLGGGDK